MLSQQQAITFLTSGKKPAFNRRVLTFPRSSQQLCGDGVGGVGPLQRHLWPGHEKTRAHGEDASHRRIHV